MFSAFLFFSFFHNSADRHTTQASTAQKEFTWSITSLSFRRGTILFWTTSYIFWPCCWWNVRLVRADRRNIIIGISRKGWFFYLVKIRCKIAWIQIWIKIRITIRMGIFIRGIFSFLFLFFLLKKTLDAKNIAYSYLLGVEIRGFNSSFKICLHFRGQSVNFLIRPPITLPLVQRELPQTENDTLYGKFKSNLYNKSHDCHTWSLEFWLGCLWLDVIHWLRLRLLNSS